MKPCSLCGTLTTLYEAGTPICLECLAQREAEEEERARVDIRTEVGSWRSGQGKRTLSLTYRR